jgi:hypothetical protein
MLRDERRFQEQRRHIATLCRLVEGTLVVGSSEIGTLHDAEKTLFKEAELGDW